MIEIDKKVFRGNDIRGKVNIDITDEFAYVIGLAFGSYIKENNRSKCVVGHDNRPSSPSLCKNLIKGITETGVDVLSLGLVTSPMFYFAGMKNNIDSGIMVTASHNPSSDNGFKIIFKDYNNACGNEINEFYEFVHAGNFSYGEGKVTDIDIRNDYLDKIKSSINLGDRKLRIAVDCGNAATTVIAKDVFSMFPFETHYLFIESDGTFPNHHPDPQVEENLEYLKKYVVDNKLDIGLAFDGDGDRIGIVDENGKHVVADKNMIIIARDIIKDLDDKRFLFDVKCSKAVEDEVNKLGGIPVLYKNGSAYIKKKVRTDNIKFGGEFSGHFFFNDRYLGYDDGIYGGLRLVEILSKTDKKYSELLDGAPFYYNTPEIKLEASDDIKWNLVDKVKEYAISKNYNINDIDGVRVTFDDGWALVRASNTGPNLTTRFEATTLERLEEIKNEFLNIIEKSR